MKVYVTEFKLENGSEIIFNNITKPIIKHKIGDVYKYEIYDRKSENTIIGRVVESKIIDIQTSQRPIKMLELDLEFKEYGGKDEE